MSCLLRRDIIASLHQFLHSMLTNILLQIDSPQLLQTCDGVRGEEHRVREEGCIYRRKSLYLSGLMRTRGDPGLPFFH
jgi:hypothetical protein